MRHLKLNLPAVFMVFGGTIVLSLSSLMASTNHVTAIAKPTWQNILKNWVKEPPHGSGDPGGNSGGRPGEALCLITPFASQPIWHTQPVFVWQGTTNTIGLRSQKTPSVFWQTSDSIHKATVKQVQYTKVPLQPGQTYEWLFFGLSTTSPMTWQPFQVMAAPEREKIAADLKTLEAKLKMEGANAETIALQRTNYFADRKQWVDVLQEVYSVKNPSKDLQKVAQEIATKTCSRDRQE
jgi:hypothetical protein